MADSLSAGHGATPLHDVSGLIPKHISSQRELNEAEFANTNEVLLKYLLRKPSKRIAPFTYHWLLTLHQEMFGKVWGWAGKIRDTELNIGVKPFKIRDELQKFAGDYEAWFKHKHSPVEISARIHHRLVWIHPFKGGNGRWARIAANIFLRQQGKLLVAWPEDELLMSVGEFRKKYIEALKKADSSDLSNLTEIHRGLMREL